MYTKGLNERNGSMQYRKVVQKDEGSGTSRHLDTYVYTNEPDGFGYPGYNANDQNYLKNTYRYYTEKTDIRGTKTKYTYDGLGEMVNSEDWGNDHKEVLTITNDVNKLPAKKENLIYNIVNGQINGTPIKQIENYIYDQYGNLTSYTGPNAARDSAGNPVNAEHTVAYTYAADKFHIPTSKTWKKDASTTCRVEYDVASNGNVTQERNIHTGNNVIADYLYDSYGNMTRRTLHYANSSGNTYVTNYEYGIDADGIDHKGAYLTKEYSIIDGMEISKKYLYDFNTGNLKATKDEKEQRTDYQYDVFKRVTKITYPDATTKQYQYSSSTNSVIYTDQNGKQFYYIIDIFGNLTKYDRAGTSADSWYIIFRNEYDSNNNKIKEIDALGHSTRYEYDSANRLRKRSFWENDTTEKKAMTINYTVGSDSSTALLCTITDEEGYIRKNYYDIENRLVKTEVTPDRSIYYTTMYAYDYVGNKTDVTDAKNYATRYTYDDLGRLASERNMTLGYETTYSYDASGKLIEEKNPRNISTYYDYDLLGRLIRTRAPAAGGGLAVTRYIYDNAGNKIKEITPKDYDAAKDTPALVNTMSGISYTYNSMNRIESVMSPEGSLLEYRKYDGNGNLKKAADGIRYTGNIDASLGTTYDYDYANRVTQVTNALNQSTYNVYDSRGKLTNQKDGNGKTTTYSYYSDGTLWKVTYPDTGVVEYKYDRLGNMTEKKDPLGKKTYYEYNGFGKLWKERDEYGKETVYSYDGNGNIASVKDKRDSITEFTYDALNKLDKKKVPLERDASGNIIYAIEDYDYDGAGNIVKKDITGTKDAGSHRIISYTYYNNNLADTVSDNSGASIKNYYDKNGNLIKTEKLRSTGVYDVSKFEYDIRDRLIKSIKLVDEADIYNASVLQNIANLRDPEYPGKVRVITGSEYDILGNRTRTIVPGAYGFLETDMANRGNYTTRFEYDVLNRLEKILWKYNGADVYSQYYYDANGNKIQERSETGANTYYTYDNVNRLKTIAKPIDYAAGRKTITYNYDLAGNKTSQVNAKGDAITYTYDRLNRQETVSDAYNRVIGVNVYDENDNIIKAIDAKGYLSGSDNNSRYGTIYEYDFANRLIKLVDPEIAALNDPAKYTAKYEYNQFGENTKETNALGDSTRYEYDNAGRLTRVTDALNISVNYSYDKSGNKLSMTDGRGKVTSNSYGASSLLKTATNAEGKSTAYQYDLALNCTRLVDRNGNETFYNYDNRNLLLSENVSQTGDSISYGYNAIGNRIQMTDGTGTLVYNYNNDDRLQNVIKGGTVQISYTYDTVGNISGITDKKGFSTTYTYDKNNRMLTALYTAAGVNKTTTYSYDNNGNRQSLVYQGGVKEEYTYDKNDRLISLANKKPNNSIISSYTYTYDLAGRQKTKSDSYGSTTNTYDAAGRIKQVESPGKTTVYGYDNAGNRISLNETYTSDQSSGYIDGASGSDIKYRIKSSEFVYSDANMLLKLVESMKNLSGTEVLQKGTNYYYDANGNQTVQESSYIKPNHPSLQEKFSATAIGDDEVVFDNIIDYVRNTFDGFDRLKRVESVKSGVRTVTEFDYNGDDLRVKKTVKKSSNNYVPEVTNYLYDGQYVVLETDSSDNVKARYIRGINYIARVDASNKVSCFLYNGHGDVVQTVNEAGTIENQYDYDIFGSVTLAIEVSYSCSIRYAGEFYDGETGLYYLRARYYNPYIGRFISEDSYLGEDSDPLSLNLYAYCSNNPIMYTDPTGHWQQGDEKLNQTSRIEISRLTDLYVSATTKAEKDKIHAAAEAIRNNSANIATTPQNSVTGQKANSILSTTSNKDSNGTYMTASQWNAISTTKNDAIVKQTINNGITQAEINTVAASKPTQSVTPNGNTNSGGSNAISTVINETIRVSSTPWGYDGPPPAGYVPNAYAIEGTGNSTSTQGKEISYLEKSLNQLVYGNYTDDVTILGTGAQVLTGVLGIDLPADIRDISADLKNGDVGMLAIDTVALLPVVGSLKYGDEVATLLKNGDEVTAAIKGAGKSLTNGAKMTTNKALDAADDFLGAGYKEVAPGVFRSKDGLRQVRMTDADITGAHGGGAHMNFETGKSITNPNGRVTFKVNNNIHIYLTD